MFRGFLCRYIHLVTACRVVRLRHLQHPCGKHWIDIDVHHVFSGFEVYVLHYIKQRFRFDAELQNFLFSQILLIGLSCSVFLGCFLVWFLFLYPPSASFPSFSLFFPQTSIIQIQELKAYRCSGNKKARSFSTPSLCFWGLLILSLAIFCNFHFTDG